jgi:DNA-binding transcriptional MerR regulator
MTPGSSAGSILRGLLLIPSSLIGAAPGRRPACQPFGAAPRFLPSGSADHREASPGGRVKGTPRGRGDRGKAVDSPPRGGSTLEGMAVALTIGEFSRITHLSIKALRRYHEAGILDPAHIDCQTGYRYYTLDQVPTAQVIHRFRELGMPVREVGELVAITDPGARAAIIAQHLERLESQLDRTRGSGHPAAAPAARPCAPRSPPPAHGGSDGCGRAGCRGPQRCSGLVRQRYG